MGFGEGFGKGLQGFDFGQIGFEDDDGSVRVLLQWVYERVLGLR